MKKIIFYIFICIILILAIFIHKDNKNEKITVAEVTHSVFYAPWYVALENNYFEDLDIEVILTSGANNVIASILSGDAQIGLCGAEAIIYSNNNNNNNNIVAFSALTKKDGQFLVLRNNIKYNSIQDINNLTILSGRAGGMPLISFKETIERNDIKNVIIDNSVDFANLSAAFIAGTADGVNLFEPNATNLVNQGYGYIADMIGNYAGILPYTTFNAKLEYIKSNKNTILKFYRGIDKGLKYVQDHNAEDIAQIIKNQFKDINEKDLIKMIDNYKKNDSWFNKAKLEKEPFDNLQKTLKNNNLITKKTSFNNLTYEVDRNK